MNFFRQWSNGYKALRIAGAGAVMLLGAGRLVGDVTAGSADTAQTLVKKMLVVEEQEAQHKGRYVYLSKERSERTGGHLWTEWVAETTAGKVRRLIAEDGQALTDTRAAQEKTKLDGFAARPDEFRREAQASKDDDTHARQLLGLLPKAFVLEGMQQEGSFIRINFKPNPAYEPQSMEERVLKGMQGTMLIDQKSSRLHELEGRLPADVNIGFGLLATIKAGSNFATTREPVQGNEWKTATMNTDINGRAIFFKSIGRKEHAEHSDFYQIPMDTTVPQAVAMLEKR
jgi:hypothetical protein